MVWVGLGSSTAIHAASEAQRSETQMHGAAELSRALLDETNRVRRIHGRRPLQRRSELEAAAGDQSEFMALWMTVQHRSLFRGQATPLDRVQRRGLYLQNGWSISENVASIALGANPTEFPPERIAAMLVRQWMESTGHRDALLDRDATHFGGAVRLAKTFGGGWAAYGTQVFLKAGSRFGA